MCEEYTQDELLLLPGHTETDNISHAQRLMCFLFKIDTYLVVTCDFGSSIVSGPELMLENSFGLSGPSLSVPCLASAFVSPGYDDMAGSGLNSAADKKRDGCSIVFKRKGPTTNGAANAASF